MSERCRLYFHMNPITVSNVKNFFVDGVDISHIADTIDIYNRGINEYAVSAFKDGRIVSIIPSGKKIVDVYYGFGFLNIDSTAVSYYEIITEDVITIKENNSELE